MSRQARQRRVRSSSLSGFLSAGRASIICATVLTAPADAQRFTDEARDLLIQDVCEVDGRVTRDNPLQCPGRRRDLKVAERLPYHKHDWPNDREIGTKPSGNQRGDAYPIEWRGLQAVVHTFDHAGGTRAFGRFDQGEGGDLYLITERSVSIALTETSKGRFYVLGSLCGEGKRAQNLVDAWLSFRDSTREGAAVTQIRMDVAEACPRAYGRSLAVWRTVPVQFRASLARALTRPIETLVSDHYSRENVDLAASMERYYFTREFGVTRWEKWQNFAHPATPATARDRRKRIVASGRCDDRYGGPTPSWELLDCREFTNIVPANDPTGDTPDFWLDALRSEEKK